ncbi:MAG TPA: DUF1707 and DUF4870 domain-containing protein [Spirillospora sp.]
MNTSHAVGDLRVSDAERESVLERLRDAYAEGRIDHDELDLRMHLAMTSKTRSDLDGLIRDLVPAPQTVHSPVLRDADNPTGEDRVLAAAAHAVAVPTLFVGPLVLMLLRRRSTFVRRHAAEAVNFQVTLLLLSIVTLGVGAAAYSVAWILSAVAAVYALGGGAFRYPFILRPVR